MSWWCQGHTFTTSMHVLSLEAYDAILGMDWLKQHSPMVTDWENHCLAFSRKNQMIQLRGIEAPPANAMKELPVEQLLKWYKGNDVWAVAVVSPEISPPSVEIPPEVQPVLESFKDVFDTPTDLPPERQYDHTVPLLPDAAPFNARPYRYSSAHKDEIEK